MDNRNKGKKAQVTLFVVIAIVLVVGVVAVLYGKDMLQKSKEAGYPEQLKLVKSDIQNCVEESAKKSIELISTQGGYVAPQLYFLDSPYHVTYWYGNQKDISPTLADMESELSWTMSTIIPECIDFSKYGIDDFSAGDISTKTTIKEDYVSFDVVYPITATIADKTYNFKEFSTKTEVRMGKMYNIGRAIVAEQAKDPEKICLTCISNLGAENNVFIDVESGTELFVPTLIDEKSKLNDAPYEFRFALMI